MLPINSDLSRGAARGSLSVGRHHTKSTIKATSQETEWGNAVRGSSKRVSVLIHPRKGGDMAFLSEFEEEDAFELERLPMGPYYDWFEYWEPADGFFIGPVSGFGWHKATPDDPYALRDHSTAVRILVDQLKKRTTPGNCVSLELYGFVDKQSEGRNERVAARLAKLRADALFDKIWKALPADNKKRVVTTNHTWGESGGISDLWPSDSPERRQLNRYVRVGISSMTCPLAPAPGRQKRR